MNRILFAGTAQIAVPLLKELNSKFKVVGVLTAMDKPKGRSLALVPSPVKEAALELGLPVLQFDSLKAEAREQVALLGADTLVSFAFGKIFGPKFLALFSGGTFNVHPSALPQFRGPSPIQYTILNGLRQGSISVQEIGEKMDEGAVFSRLDFDLVGNEDTQILTSIVSQKAALFVPDVIKSVFCGNIKGVLQTGEASCCKMLEKDDAKVDFNDTVSKVHAKIRAFYPWPKAYALYQQKEVFFCGVWGGFEYLSDVDKCDTEPGTVVCVNKQKGIGIACKDGIVYVNKLQLPSKKETDFVSFVNGNSWIKEGVFK